MKFSSSSERSDMRSCSQENFALSIGKNNSTDVSAIHYYWLICSNFLLAFNKETPDFLKYRNCRSRITYFREADFLADVAVTVQHTAATCCR